MQAFLPFSGIIWILSEADIAGKGRCPGARGAEGQAEFSWQMFSWHDEWVYETLPGGQVQAQPALEPDGRLTMRGTFSAQVGSKPVTYAYRILPGAESLQVRCELQKSAALKLTRGIWLDGVGSRDKLQGSERVWFAPAAYGTVSAAPFATADRVWMELYQGRSLCLGLPGYFPKGMDTILSHANLAWRERCLSRACELALGVVAIKVLGRGIPEPAHPANARPAGTGHGVRPPCRAWRLRTG